MRESKVSLLEESKTDGGDIKRDKKDIGGLIRHMGVNSDFSLN